MVSAFVKNLDTPGHMFKDIDSIYKLRLNEKDESKK